jgi:hypothetical protein
MPEDGPQADTTQSPLPLVAMLCTLMPGPRDHIDFVSHARPKKPLLVESGAVRIALKEGLPAANIITVDHYGNMRPQVLSTCITILKEYFREAYHQA